MTRKTSTFWDIRQPVPRGTAIALAFIMPVVVIAAWCIVSYGGLAPSDFLPSPTEVVRGTLQLFIQYDLWTSILISTKRIVLAFLLASAFAVPLGVAKLQVIRTVLVPAALPDIFDSFRVMNAILWTYVILAEAVNPEHGLGYMVELARTHQKASWSFAGLLVIGGIGLFTDFLIRAVSNMLFRWREEETL